MILLIDPLREFSERVAEAAVEHVIRHVVDVAAGHRVLDDRGRDIEVVVLGPALEQDEALDVARKMREQYPAMSIVLCTMSAGSALYREAMRSGASDVLAWDAERDEIRDVVGRAVDAAQRLRAVEPAEPAGKVGTTVATFSTKGGCGKSFIATNLAAALADRYPGEVVLVDLDLQAGDAAIMLQLMPERGLLETVEMGDDLDEEALAGFLTSSGDLKMLAAPPTPVAAEAVQAADVVRVLDMLRRMFRWVVIDGPPSFTDVMLSALDFVDLVVVVSSLDVPSIKNLKMSVATLFELGVTRNRMKLLLNRADSKVGLTIREVEKSLGTTIDLTLPSSREVPFAVNQGIPIVRARPKAPVSKALFEVRDVVERLEQQGKESTATGEAAHSGSWSERRRRSE